MSFPFLMRVGSVSGIDEDGNIRVRSEEHYRTLVLPGSSHVASHYPIDTIMECLAIQQCAATQQGELVDFAHSWRAQDRRIEYGLNGQTRVDLVLCDDPLETILFLGIWDHPSSLFVPSRYRLAEEGSLCERMYIRTEPSLMQWKQLDDTIIKNALQFAPAKIVHGSYPGEKRGEGGYYQLSLLRAGCNPPGDKYRTQLEALIREHLPSS